MGSSLWTTLSLALGDSAPGVPSTGPIQIMFMFGPPEPKGCSLERADPSAAWEGPSNPGTRTAPAPDTPISQVST